MTAAEHESECVVVESEDKWLRTIQNGPANREPIERMKMKLPQCLVCEETTVKVNSYKQYWFVCKHCGSVFSERKRKYPAEYVLPYNVARRFVPRVALENLYHIIEVVKDPARYYDHYSSECCVPVKGTKWERKTERFKELFKRLGFDPRRKSILEISGGPGFFARDMAEICDKYVVTEYSPVAVAAMRKNLGVDAVVFDYNSDSLEAVANGKYDFVIIEASINFCHDIPRFASALKRILKPGGYVYVDFVEPTLATMMHWQNAEYIYHALYKIDTMKRFFREGGLKVVADLPFVGTYYTDTCFKKLGRTVLIAPVLLLYSSLARLKGIEHDLFMLGCGMVLQ